MTDHDRTTNLSILKPPGFLVALASSPNSRLRRGADISLRYITSNGKLTPYCDLSPTNSLIQNGQLAIQDGAIYSTSKGVKFMPFIPSPSPGNVSTTWKLSHGFLKWNNKAFFNGTALVCSDVASDTVEIYFSAPPPTSGARVTLMTVPC